MKVTLEIDCERERAFDDVRRIIEEIKRIEGARELNGSGSFSSDTDKSEIVYRYEIT